MEIESYDSGVPCWVDLATSDTDKAGAFYSTLFGWEIRPGPPEAGGYAIALLGGKAAAGLGPQQNPGQPVWSSYIKVDDAEASAARITVHGGSAIVQPLDVMDLGRMGVFADPAGAVFAVWQPLSFPGAAVANEPGAFSWNELMTTDLHGAKNFYNAVFDWDAESYGPDTGPGGYTEFKLRGRSVAGAMTRPETMPADVPPHWGVYFSVADTDASAKQAGDAGGAVLVGPTDIEPGRFAVVADPTGAVFNIITLKEPAAQ
jgi:hypothetical protein